MPLLDLLNYRGVECEYLGGHPAGGMADLACLAEGVLRGRALEGPVGLPQASQGGPQNSTDNLYYLIYTYGFTYFDIGKAAAASVLVMLALAVTLGVGGLLRCRVTNAFMYSGIG
jgi:hypothetical protein